MKYLNKKNILLFLQAVFVFLIAIGALPRYYAFFIAISAAVYVLFAEQIDAICFASASIPFYIALPITENFDTLIYWRILFLEMLAIFIIKNRAIIAEKYRNIAGISGKKEKLKKIWEDYKIEILSAAIFMLAFLSLIGAPNKTEGAKRILYYGNIFIFYLIIKYSIKTENNIKKILRHLGAAAALFLIGGFSQLLFVYISGCERFWHFWSSKISLAFYGQRLSQFVSFNNSWLAFSSSGSANLRMFSFFWCSLAFAMSMIMLSAVPLILYKKIWSFVFLGFLMMAVILSGSRGAWLSIAFPIFFLLILSSLKKISVRDKTIYIKRIFAMFLLFGVLFPLSPLFLRSRDMEASSIGRIWTIKDAGETSNKARIEIWKASLRSILKNPILGTGIANFSAEEEKFGGEWKTTSHNTFLYIATEAGLPAAILSLIICFYLLKDFTKEFYLSPPDNEFLKMLFLSIAVVLAWVLGYGLIIDSLLTADKTSIIFAVLIGLAYGAKRISGSKRNAAGIGNSPCIYQ